MNRVPRQIRARAAVRQHREFVRSDDVCQLVQPFYDTAIERSWRDAWQRWHVTSDDMDRAYVAGAEAEDRIAAYHASRREAGRRF